MTSSSRTKNSIAMSVPIEFHEFVQKINEKNVHGLNLEIIKEIMLGKHVSKDITSTDLSEEQKKLLEENTLLKLKIKKLKKRPIH